ncbi:MAG: hypothetical protein K5871_10985 [Lachnospiraceae bacterium]|nr:hypothetical protein [Lachnospiraceae bacterium]
MNLSTTLTTRDKRLLYMLLMIVIIFLFGWCLIRPLYKKIVADQERIEIAASLRATNEAKQIGFASAEALTTRFNDELDSSISQYYDYMDSSEIDKLVTSYILKKGMQARDLTILMPEGYVLEEPYAYSNFTTVSTYVPEETETMLDMGTANEVTVEEEKVSSGNYFRHAVMNFLTGSETSQVSIIPTPMEQYNEGLASTTTESSGLLCVQLIIVVEGSPETCQKMIDELTHNPSVRVTGFNWISLDPITYLQEDGSILIYENASRQLEIRVNLYMKDYVEPAASAS